MRIKTDYKLHELGTENVAIPVGEEAATFNGMIRLNETGAFLWRTLENGASEEDLVNALLESFQVALSVARADVENFITLLRNNNLLVE